MTDIITSRNEVVAKVMFLLVSVILLTGGVSASMHAGIPPGADTALEQTTPGADTPPGADPTGSRLRDTVNERPVRILLECILGCGLLRRIKVKLKFQSQITSLQGQTSLEIVTLLSLSLLGKAI